MQMVNTQIWLETCDWETVGVTYSTLRKTTYRINSIITTGKGREKLYLYSSLSAKHQALFAEMVKKFMQPEPVIAPLPIAPLPTAPLPTLPTPKTTDTQVYERLIGYATQEKYLDYSPLYPKVSGQQG